jgi:hypothetical protein
MTHTHTRDRCAPSDVSDSVTQPSKGARSYLPSLPSRGSSSECDRAPFFRSGRQGQKRKAESGEIARCSTPRSSNPSRTAAFRRSVSSSRGSQAWLRKTRRGASGGIRPDATRSVTSTERSGHQGFCNKGPLNKRVWPLAGKGWTEPQNGNGNAQIITMSKTSG